MMKKKILVAAGMTFSLALPAIAAADGSPWLPVPGSTQISLGYINQTGDEFYLGTTETPLPEKLKQDTYSIGAQYGLTDAIAIDARLNYAKINFGPASESAAITLRRAAAFAHRLDSNISFTALKKVNTDKITWASLCHCFVLYSTGNTPQELHVATVRPQHLARPAW